MSIRNSIVIVNFNSIVALSRMLQALQLEEAPEVEVIVVDNDSFDGSADIIAAEVPQVRLIRMESNRGFAAAVNRGMLEAVGDVTIICHADLICPAVLLSDLADRVREAQGRRVIGAVPRIQSPDGADQPNIGRLPTIARGIAGMFDAPKARHAYFPYLDHLANHEWASMACFAVITGAMIQMGGLDEKFILYYAESDFCERMHNTRDRILVRRDMRIIHNGGGADQAVPPSLARIMRKDQMTFFNKHRSVVEQAVLRGAVKVRGWIGREDK